MFKNLILGLFSALLLLPAQEVLAEEFEVHGSSTAIQALLSPNQDAIEQRTGHRLKLVSKGSDSGVMNLVAGAADIAVISTPLDDVVDQLNKKWAGSVDRGKLKSHPIGSARVAFAVHRENPVRELRLDQVLDILAGRIDNWREVGGLDAPIQIVAELRGGGVRAVVENMLDERGEVIAPLTTVRTAVMAAYAIEHLPHAMAITTVAALDQRVVPSADHGGPVATNTPVAADDISRKRLVVTDRPIERSIYLVTFGRPNKAVSTLIAAVRSTVQKQSVSAPTKTETGTITLLSR